MKKRWMAGLLVILFACTMMPSFAFAETAGAATNNSEQVVSSEQEASTGAKEEQKNQENAAETQKSDESGKTNENQEVGKDEDGPKVQSSDSEQDVTSTTYSVASAEELKRALEKASEQDAKTITMELTGDVSAAESSFGVKGKKLIVTSASSEKFTLTLAGRTILAGECVFDKVNVKGTWLYCNGFSTEFTENSDLDLARTLYGGGYRTDVDSTHVVMHGSGKIDQGVTNGTNNVVGGSYNASVKGDSYLEIVGKYLFRSGNLLTPASARGDGTSGDGNNCGDIYIGGTAKLIYDVGNAEGTSSPLITGTDGCEMKGDVILDIRSGRANEVCGQYEWPAKSVIHGNLHIICGAEKYENTDRVLRLSSNWPIVGGGHSMGHFDNAHQVDGNITIDTYENVWGWDRSATDVTSGDVPQIIGAKKCNVGGNVEINVHGSHMQNIYGTDDEATIAGKMAIRATNVELRNKYYETKYDENDIVGNYDGTCVGPITIDVNGGDQNLVLLTTDETAKDGSVINVTGQPKIRTGILGTTATRSPETSPKVNLNACNAEIPFVQVASELNVTGNSKVKLNGIWLAKDLNVEKDSSLTSDDEDSVELDGSASVLGTWEQLYTKDGNQSDLTIHGNVNVGEDGTFISDGTAKVEGNVTNAGRMVLKKAVTVKGNYEGKNAELRLSAVAEGKNYSKSSIPLRIQGLSTGNTTVNTMDEEKWTEDKTPSLGDNYIISKKDGNNPEQETFILGNKKATEQDRYLKRIDDTDDADNYMWQVSKDYSKTLPTISPMDMTVYVGGQGYHGVIGTDGNFSSNDLPEMGVYLELPEDINALIGNTDNNPKNLEGKISLTYRDPNKGSNRKWNLKLYGEEGKSTTVKSGRKVYIYKLEADPAFTGTLPVRMQFTADDGSVMVDSDFSGTVQDQFRDYRVNFFAEDLNESYLKLNVTEGEKTVSRPIRLGSGALHVRANQDKRYSAIENGTPKVNAENRNTILASTAQSGTEYYINTGNVAVRDPSGVQLLVDSTMDDQLLHEYLNREKNTDGKYSYEFRYLDLVDTHNGNTQLRMGDGQEMDIYWPVPADASKNSAFHVVHFKGLERDTDMDINELLQKVPPVEIACEKVQLDGDEYVHFRTDSFSPFALLYEKDKGSSETDKPSTNPNKPSANPKEPGNTGNSGNVGHKTKGGTAAKESGTTAKKQTGIDTGDSSHLGLWSIVLLLAAAGVGIIYRSRKGKESVSK